MNAMEKVRVAVVGFGQIGPVHLRSYQRIPDKVEVVSVCDLLPERRKLAQEQYGVKQTCDNYADLFSMDVDVIDVCIPTHEHHALVMAAAEHGKHVFCEKPMAMKMEDAHQMEAACRKAGVKLQLGFVRRFDNEWNKFRQVVQDGLLGRPVVWRSAAAGQGAPTPWFFQRELGGGPFMDGAVHNYDFGHFMFGPVKKVAAWGTTIQPERTAIDTGVANILYASGDTLQMMWSWGLQQGCRGDGLHDVLGEKGALAFRAPKGESPGGSEVGHLVISRPGDEEEAHTFVRNDMFADEMEHFIDCVREDREPMVTGKHGQDALQVALAVLEAFETGKPVEL